VALLKEHGEVISLSLPLSLYLSIYIYLSIIHICAYHGGVHNNEGPEEGLEVAEPVTLKGRMERV